MILVCLGMFMCMCNISPLKMKNNEEISINCNIQKEKQMICACLTVQQCLGRTDGHSL